MKKTYIIPEMLSVQLGTCKMMAESPNITIDDDDSVGAGDVQTKEITDKNIWDEEW